MRRTFKRHLTFLNGMLRGGPWTFGEDLCSIGIPIALNEMSMKDGDIVIMWFVVHEGENDMDLIPSNGAPDHICALCGKSKFY